MIIQKEDDIIKYLAGDYIKVVLSNKRDKTSETNKVNINAMISKSKKIYQFCMFIENQVFHENVKEKEIANNKIVDLFKSFFNQLNIFEKDLCLEIKRTKKGKLFLTTTKKNTESKISSQNNDKNYILKPDLKIEPLVDLGVLTKDGQVISKEYSKFKQINKFIEIIDNNFKEFDKEELNILDFGCGKSYLTFIIYYYFNYIRKIKTHIIGIDLKADVIDKCNLIAEKYGYNNLEFVAGDIEKYLPTRNFDMMISLHACDVATDYALFNALKWGVKYIFSVPCCHHELKGQVNKKFDFLTKYSILKDRFSSLLTDAVRGNILRSFGYKVNICEFIDFEETPKNIMIKAIKTQRSIDLEMLNEVKKILNEFDCKQTMYEKSIKLVEIYEN